MHPLFPRRALPCTSSVRQSALEVPGLLTLARLLASGPARECHTFLTRRNPAALITKMMPLPDTGPYRCVNIGPGRSRARRLLKSERTRRLSAFGFRKAKSESTRLSSPSLLFLLFVRVARPSPTFAQDHVIEPVANRLCTPEETLDFSEM